MKAEKILIVTCWLIVLMRGVAALGDGKIFIRYDKQADILQPTQKVYIEWDGSQEKLVIQTKYEGPAEEMVWIVPVPAKPEVEKADPNLFQKLSRRTLRPDLSYTYFRDLHFSGGGGARRRSDPVEWRRRIGDYDVVLLKPDGGDDVIHWLNDNEFGVPDASVPILRDYIETGWWMVASRIHPDALTEITREKLAQGLLDPLEMTFPSRQCIYPLRLTGLVAGPVEELIYIEGQSHFQPATLSDGQWEIDVFGGPRRSVPNASELSVLEQALKIAAGGAELRSGKQLTKLRRTFKPEEMTSDLVFEKMDYVTLMSSTVPLRIAQAATQYGRRRDPAGIPHILKSLSPKELEAVQPTEGYVPSLDPMSHVLSRRDFTREKQALRLRSSIWALGEMAVEHGCTPAMEEALLRCASQENQHLRMEAYVALIKGDSKRQGPIMLDRLTKILGNDANELAQVCWPDSQIGQAEADIIADWIDRYGTAQEKTILAETLARNIINLPGRILAQNNMWGHAEMAYWPRWLVEKVVLIGRTRSIPALRSYRVGWPEMHPYVLHLLKAEAACGSLDALDRAARWLAGNEERVLREEMATDSGAYTSIVPARRRSESNLRTRILRNTARNERWRGHPVFPHVHDAAVRKALRDYELSDWYALYLLAQIRTPTDQDREIIRVIWRKEDEAQRLVACDILWLWKDESTLLNLRGKRASAAVHSEIEKALQSLGSE